MQKVLMLCQAQYESACTYEIPALPVTGLHRNHRHFLTVTGPLLFHRTTPEYYCVTREEERNLLTTTPNANLQLILSLGSRVSLSYEAELINLSN